MNSSLGKKFWPPSDYMQIANASAKPQKAIPTRFIHQLIIASGEPVGLGGGPAEKEPIPI